MKIHIGRLVAMAWYCLHFLVRGVWGRGEGEGEEERIRPSAEWLDEFYHNPDNVLTIPVLTPRVYDVPDYIPHSRPAKGTPQQSFTDTKPPEHYGRQLGPPEDDQAIALNILFNADGIQFEESKITPPNPIGDVGKAHYVQMTDSRNATIVRILNKSDGSLNKTFELYSLGSGACAAVRGDGPTVLYDQFASRWLLSEIAGDGNTICVYISTSDDPTGAYFEYQYALRNFPSAPKFGVWHDAYYFGSRDFDSGVYALERSKMLMGLPAVLIRKSGPTDLAGFDFQMLLPVDADGALAPPPGPGLFVRHVDDEYHKNYVTNPNSDLFEIYALAVDFATNTSSSLSLLQTIQVKEFGTSRCSGQFDFGSFLCVAQPGTKFGLDPFKEVVRHRPQYRNFGTHESIVATWVVGFEGTDRHAVRWMELRKVAGANAWSVYQENDYSPDATNRFTSSIAMNKCGDIALGYSVSSFKVFPGIRVTGRLAAVDPLNQLDPKEVTIVAGGGSQFSSILWGEHSAMVVDPDDDYTFWYTNEYIPDLSGTWTTRITKFTIGTIGCPAPPPAEPAATDEPVDPLPGTSCGPVRRLMGMC